MGGGIGNTDSTQYSAAVNLNEAHVVIYRWSSSANTISVNVNGTSTGKTVAATAARTSYRILIGSMNGMNYFNGKIARIKFFTTALSDADVVLIGKDLATTYNITTSY